MSRCFPFPPPGYEKKARADDVDLLKKEKHKEKKHKKEKRDKGKTEDKDRKGKDKSDGKYRDKKDRKDKSKEKKKDKEREKGDKTSTSQEKKIHAQVESCNGGHKLAHKEREQVKDQSITSNENKKSTPFHAHIGEKPMEKSLYDDMDKFVLDLCSRIEDEEKGSASQSTEKSPFTGQTNHEMVKNGNGIIPGDKEKKKDKRVDIRKINGQRLSVGATVGVHSIVHNIVGTEKNKVVDIGRRLQNRAEEVSKIFEKSLERKDKNHKQVSVGATISVSTMVQNIAGKKRNENKGDSIGDWFQKKAEEIPSILEKSSETRDKNHRKESEDKRGSKRKDKHKEKKSHGKDKEREKEKKKEEKAKGKSEQKIKGHDRVEDSLKNGHLISQIKKMPPLVLNGDRDHIHGQSTKNPPFVPDGDKNLVPGQNTNLPHFVSDGDINFVFGLNKKLPNFVLDGDKYLITGQNTKLLPFVANGDINLILGQNTKLPPFVPDGDRNLILGQNMKLPPFVPDGDRNLIPVQNTKLSHFVPNGDRNLILGQMRKFPPSVPGGDRNLFLEQNTKFPPSVLDGNRTPAIEGNIKKRKDIVANGFLHETNVGPNKKARPIHSSIQNGRKLEPCQTPVLHTPEKKAPPPNNLMKMHNNEHKANGKIEIQPLSICSKKPSSSLSSSPILKTKADEMVVAPKVKPPHPDTKYLSEVFLVPKIEEWCDFGEEEWLFSRKALVSVSSGPTKASETVRVWAKAVQIESADVCALPYVIPY